MAEDGSVYVTGSFKDFICFDTLCFPAASPDNSDIFLAKYDSVGVLQWAKVLGGGGVDQGKALALDSQGNVFLGAGFSGPLQIDSFVINPFDPNLYPFGSSEIIVAKFSFDGKCLSVYHPGGSRGAALLDVCIDYQDNLTIVGQSISDTLWFGHHFTVKNARSALDMFLVKYNKNQKFIFAKNFPVYYHGINYLTLTSNYNGDILVAGQSGDSISIDSFVLSEGTSFQQFLISWDSLGNHRWSETFRSLNIHGLNIDEKNNIYFSGNFTEEEFFDTLRIAGANSYFLTKYNSLGKVQWVRRSYTGIPGWMNLFYNRGQVYIIASFSGSMVVENHTFSSPHEENILIVRYDTTGGLIWVRTTGEPSLYWYLAIQGNETGDLTIGGMFNYNKTSFDDYFIQNSFPGYMEPFIAQFHRDSLPPLPQPPAEWKVYPNPFEDHIFLWGDFLQGVLELSLYDLSGREVWKTQMLVEDTIFPLRVSVPVLPGGFYLLRIGQRGKEIVKKMVRV
ncbi:MAG: T9SS type A sorting domain-containing protein [Bacteroidia bacterium]